MNHLERLAAAQREQFSRRSTPLPHRTDGVRPFPPHRDGPPALIAEFKRSSPSHGPFEDVGREAQIRRYEALGASAISILVTQEGFSGSVDDLQAARAETALPLLYKGFVSLQGQIDEAHAYGADAVLLIAAVLRGELGRFLRHAQELGLEALCEVHDAEEFDAACAAGAHLLGVNNRDLRTLQIDTANFLALAARAPHGVTLIAESGYRTRKAVREAVAAGARGLLVGEALLAGGELQAPWREVLAHVG